MSERSMEAGLAAHGVALGLETIGRHSDRPRSVTIGFLEEPDGSILVAATAETTHWARNLQADPACTVELDGSRRACIATELTGAERAAAIAALILKYGTPAERLGTGPAFRLRP